ncbi:hypothetical protein RJ640_026760 [Escallonia rubra]|uniref:Uncharacterized protein n=1 Tax=Escallonia rubra TaxID=112253 RepID=A0AA88QZ09_9ASTE|nr:hypothetical protein RJ640_026760 [Escallonia rubra]
MMLRRIFCLMRRVQIYAVGSASNDGIHLLDFYPDPSSPCHVDNVECMDSLPKDNIQRKQNWFVPLSEGVTACASHPLNGTIVAGTKMDPKAFIDDLLQQSSLLMISQKQQPFKGAHCSDNEDRINS